MEIYSVGDFKTKFSDILEKISNGEEVGLSYGKAKNLIAKLVPYSNKKLKKRKLGLLEGKVKVTFHGDWEVSPEELFEDEIFN
jgi:antitoxin (DNA-binding transcriptional repressor) of toxin-antitoxin stability system